MMIIVRWWGLCLLSFTTVKCICIVILVILYITRCPRKKHVSYSVYNIFIYFSTRSKPLTCLQVAKLSRLLTIHTYYLFDQHLFDQQSWCVHCMEVSITHIIYKMSDVNILFYHQHLTLLKNLDYV